MSYLRDCFLFDAYTPYIARQIHPGRTIGLKALTHTEKQIVELLRQGDKSAIRMIYENYSEVLYGVIFQMIKNDPESEDVFQESVLKIWRFAKSYDASKGRLFTWMVNICRNTAIDKMRSKGFKNQSKIQGKEKLVDIAERLGEEGFNPDQIGLREKVAKLEPKFLEVIQVVYFEGYSHAEAAQKLEIPLGTLKTRVRQGLNELRKIMKE